MGQHFTLGAGLVQIMGSTCCPGCMAVAAYAPLAGYIIPKVAIACSLQLICNQTAKNYKNCCHQIQILG